jgi:hypothetical protein
MIELRKQLTTMYGINLINASDSKIGSELTLKLYCKKTGKNIKDVRSMRTYRKSIKFSEIIFPYISFKSVEFNMLLNHFKKVEIKDTKSDSEFSVNYKGFQFDYGNGGIHGSISNSIVESDKEYIIIDADVALNSGASKIH